MYGVQPVPHGNPCPQRAPPRVQFAPDDPTRLLRLAQIPKNPLAMVLFNRNQVRYVTNMACLWGTYCALRESEPIASCATDNKGFAEMLLQHNTVV